MGLTCLGFDVSGVVNGTAFTYEWLYSFHTFIHKDIFRRRKSQPNPNFEGADGHNPPPQPILGLTLLNLRHGVMIV